MKNSSQVLGVTGLRSVRWKYQDAFMVWNSWYTIFKNFFLICKSENRGPINFFLRLAHRFLISISKTIWFFWWVPCHFSEQPWDVLAFFEIDFVFNLLMLRDAIIYKYPLSP